VPRSRSARCTAERSSRASGSSGFGAEGTRTPDPTLPARVIGQISCWPVSPDVTISLYSLGFMPLRVAA
jgi:hypothetical protein